MEIVFDLEANSLKPDKIWCAVAQDIATGEFHEFDKVWKDTKPLSDFLKGVTRIVGHNLLGYDLPVLLDLVPDCGLKPNMVVDTLVVSRLVNFSLPGGHDLEAWGNRLGIKKPEISEEQWLEYDPVFLHRCREDVRINRALYNKFLKFINSPIWALSMKIEHSTADYCRRLSDNGFPFDIAAAESLEQRWDDEAQALLRSFQKDFPPRYRPTREITPVMTKAGKLHSKDFRWYQGEHGPIDEVFSAGDTFVLVERIDFDPASKHQCIDRLWEAGWKPITKTDGYKDYLRQRGKKDPEKGETYKKYGWKLDKLNLDTLPEGAAKSAHGLVRWLELTGKLNQLRGWIKLFNERTGRIHGKFHSIGAWSGRCSHSSPNMANASSDPEVRSLWTAGDGFLVGCDAAGIQLRVLAHYMDDPRFTFAVTEGNKEDGTDPHTLNSRALGEICLRRPHPRDDAKTFIYAFLLGAQPGKISEIFECTVHEAETAVNQFIESYPGLAALKRDRIPEDARRGYFQGFDGRYVRQEHERLILAGYLQNGESVIMKLARMFWENDLRKLGVWYQPVNFVHDEWQTLARSREDAEIIGSTQADAIRRAGEYLQLKCPMGGEFQVGLNWSETH